MMTINIPMILLTITCETCNKDEMYCWCFHSSNWIKILPVFAVFIVLSAAVFIFIYINYKKKRSSQ